MSYKILCDSCTDLPMELQQDEHIVKVALSIQIEEENIIDDETFNQIDFLRKMNDSKNCPKSSCPSPDSYMSHFDEAEDIYVVTLSSRLSGSYNSAELAKKLYLEDHPNKNIEVVDSKSASVGQTLIAMKIQELIEKGFSFSEVVSKVNEFRDGLKTKFVLETLDTLRKNGRLSNLTAVICSALNIKPIMGADDGNIVKIDQARGIEKALLKMVKYMEEDVIDAKNRVLGISHCNNFERAIFVKEEIMKCIPFAKCFIANTGGISSLYANEGGIIVCY
ncbi:DegV family protein [Lachnoclostridium phytofermentans]|uniref:DegV family protein n=1 Tax=Lachnoclostridium phytofermentans (strain ATCC 700394 / DSM 18823 / ISDg) TaxID=357809 RepID=A9KT67_LACP7|nr:DegV family protein [Lachnoclostridium phytofermentans]ABX43697.1 DegV family protein [Lachnoclostridium phytofermentans ISDg]